MHPTRRARQRPADAVAAIAGALIGALLAMALPAGPQAPAVATPPSRPRLAPPAPATRDEALVRRRSLPALPSPDDGPDQRRDQCPDHGPDHPTDTRPDGHALIRREACATRR